MNIFKKLHSLAVEESKLVEVLKVMDIFGIRPNKVYRMKDNRDHFYVNFYATKKNGNKVKRAICRNSRIGESNVSFVF